MLKLDPKTGDDGKPVEVQGMGFEDMESALYDLDTDPEQTTPLDDPKITARLCQQIITNMAMLDAPQEAYHRFGLQPPGDEQR